MNEPAHLVAGLGNWQFGRFDLYRVNPPMVRMIAALPVLAVGCENDWHRFYEGPQARPEFAIGEDFVAANGRRSLRLFTIARWACIPISLIGGLICFQWSRDLWGHNIPGLISLSLWCLSPNILAHGELITPDCAATSFGLGASYCFWRWLRQPTWRRTLAAGVLLGLAEMTKLTWVILFGLWPLLWLMRQWIKRRSPTSDLAQPSTLNQSIQLLGILLLGLYVLNLGYWFDGTLTPLKDFTFVSSTFTGLEESGVPGNRFANTWLEDLPIPVPKQFLLGIDVQKHDLEHFLLPSYLRGEWKYGGWWYYYLYGLAVKTPHGLQILFLLSLVTMVRLWCVRRTTDAADSEYLGPAGVSADSLLILLIPIVVLVIVSSQTQFNHHVRYVLPVLGFAFTFIGSTGLWFVRRSCRTGYMLSELPPSAEFKGMPVSVAPIARGAVIVSLVWGFTSTIFVYPHQLAYFNELAGGPMHGHEHLLHSSFDWGQDILLLRDWLDANGSEADGQYTVATVARRTQRAIGITAPVTPRTKSDYDDSTASDPHNGGRTGWHILSIGRLLHQSERYRDLKSRIPDERIGYTIVLHKFPLASTK